MIEAVNAPVRIGVLGTSRIGGAAIFGATAQYAGATVVALASRDKDRGRRYADRWNVPAVEPSYQLLLERPDVDAVYIPLPVSLHARWAVEAAAAGKHVLVEKPFSRTSAEAEAVVGEGARRNVVVAEAFHYAYHPCMTRLLEFVGGGGLGALEHIEAVFEDDLSRVPGDTSVYANPELGGGSLFHWGSYCVHFSRMVASSEPRVIDAEMRYGPTGIDTGVRADLLFADGVRAQIVACVDKTRRMYARVSGTKGAVTLDRFVVPQHLVDVDPLTFDVEGRTWTEKPGRCPTYYYQLVAFCEAISKKETMLTGGDDPVSNMRTLDAIRRVANPSGSH